MTVSIPDLDAFRDRDASRVFFAETFFKGSRYVSSQFYHILTILFFTQICIFILLNHYYIDD